MTEELTKQLEQQTKDFKTQTKQVEGLEKQVKDLVKKPAAGSELKYQAKISSLGAELKSVKTQLVAAVKEEEKYKMLADVISAAAVGGAYLSILNKGRKAELEADRIGSQYSERLNFEPWGIAKMFQTFKEKSNSGKVTTLEKLTSSHPTHDERIDQVAYLSSLFWEP